MKTVKMRDDDVDFSLSWQQQQQQKLKMQSFYYIIEEDRVLTPTPKADIKEYIYVITVLNISIKRVVCVTGSARDV